MVECSRGDVVFGLFLPRQLNLTMPFDQIRIGNMGTLKATRFRKLARL
jgi:hypothetical protein